MSSWIKDYSFQKKITLGSIKKVKAKLKKLKREKTKLKYKTMLTTLQNERKAQIKYFKYRFYKNKQIDILDEIPEELKYAFGNSKYAPWTSKERLWSFFVNSVFFGDEKSALEFWIKEGAKFKNE